MDYTESCAALDAEYRQRTEGVDLFPRKKPAKKVYHKPRRNPTGAIHVRARELGYSDGTEAAVALYESGMSMREVGSVLGVQWHAIRYRLNQAGTEMRPRGGCNNYRHGRYTKNG